MTKADEFRGLSTATISDALDRLGIPGSCHGVSPLFNEAVLCGPAFTVRYVPTGLPKGTVGDFLDDVPPGAIVVIDNYGRTDCTVWGDIMTTLAVERGVGGTVIDGVCRDVMKAIKLQYPAYTRGRFMRTGKDRVELAEINGTVSIGGVRVRPKDILVGDANGVVVVPGERAAEVAEIARGIESVENDIISAIAEGASLRMARQRFGYHTLQRST
ncbi:RraA family protein [Chelatococcus asaccharovorans]|uniref:RraA family protein n=1 Tax=Chelatococcus asaccharovorans TaxID=28210 RepID=UPI00224C6978|nr:RraA family protein [Chelatococcus asaccharovorans]CAH1667428.1 Regulator of RNase E activity RraA [Chelatococcus asaccharovorans]CAH1680954.1 Regulator of RNase E activity RraA [Chelatococcus asaccharovorans]